MNESEIGQCIIIVELEVADDTKEISVSFYIRIITLKKCVWNLAVSWKLFTKAMKCAQKRENFLRE